MVCPSVVHLNPAKYNDPLAFDPWRWEVFDFLAFSRIFSHFGIGFSQLLNYTWMNWKN